MRLRRVGRIELKRRVLGVEARGEPGKTFMANAEQHARVARIDPIGAGGEIDRREVLRRLRLRLRLRGRLLAAKGECVSVAPCALTQARQSQTQGNDPGAHATISRSSPQRAI